ncbi:Tyrosine recombinase XerD [bioreactor metagenome]|uniref:Tyrosine recombinase XerD n=1 Tax=bioreactor metagenome TaxID=1076179 RepID=A0A645HKX4_9ZZZZ
MTEQALRRSWEHYCKDSWVTITPHQLNHAFSTILFDAEISSKSAQKMLGHADYKTIIEIFTHISTKREQSNTEKLNDFLKNY